MFYSQHQQGSGKEKGHAKLCWDLTCSSRSNFPIKWISHCDEFLAAVVCIYLNGVKHQKLVCPDALVKVQSNVVICWFL